MTSASRLMEFGNALLGVTYRPFPLLDAGVWSSGLGAHHWPYAGKAAGRRNGSGRSVRIDDGWNVVPLVLILDAGEASIRDWSIRLSVSRRGSFVLARRCSGQSRACQGSEWLREGPFCSFPSDSNIGTSAAVGAVGVEAMDSKDRSPIGDRPEPRGGVGAHVCRRSSRRATATLGLASTTSVTLHGASESRIRDHPTVRRAFRSGSLPVRFRHRANAGTATTSSPLASATPGASPTTCPPSIPIAVNFLPRR